MCSSDSINSNLLRTTRRTDRGDGCLGNCKSEVKIKNPQLTERKTRHEIENLCRKESKSQRIELNKKYFDEFVRDSETLKKNYKQLKANCTSLNLNQSILTLHCGYYKEEFNKVANENGILKFENEEIKEENKILLLKLEKSKEKNRKLEQKLKNLKREVLAYLTGPLPMPENVDTTHSQPITLFQIKKLLHQLTN